MRSNNFDDRYPAMFQPGGAGPGAQGEPDSGQPATENPAAQPEQAPSDPVAQARAGTAGTEQPAGNTAEAAAGRNAGHGHSPAWRWPVPLAAAIAMVAAGLFSLTAQYWLPVSMEMDPAAFHGIVLQPWGQVIYPAAPALIGTGTGILAALLFLASRRNAAAEPPLRAALWVLAVLTAVGGWVSLFATYMFPEVTYFGMGGSGQPPTPWTYLLMPLGTWLLSVSLLMLAALFAVPRRWQSGEPGTKEQPVGGRPSTGRALSFGAAAAVAGLLALFAPYLFPLATGSTTIEVSAGNTVSQSGWPLMGQFLAAPLLLSGLMIVAWAVLHLALAPGRAKPVP